MTKIRWRIGQRYNIAICARCGASRRFVRTRPGFILSRDGKILFQLRATDAYVAAPADSPAQAARPECLPFVNQMIMVIPAHLSRQNQSSFRILRCGYQRFRMERQNASNGCKVRSLVLMMRRMRSDRVCVNQTSIRNFFAAPPVGVR